ncbi:yghU, partial [Symbiodinium microadriaticum]
SIMVYLADKYQRFIPSDPALRAEVMNWLFWQVGGQGPITGACFGHFFVYAPDDRGAAREYALARYGMEVQRLCSVLENHLKDRSYMVNEEYTIADMAIYPWFNQLLTGYNHKSGLTAKDFLSVEENYPSVVAWALRIRERPAVQRGLQVYHTKPLSAQLSRYMDTFLQVCPWNGAHTKPWLAPSTQEDEN